MTDERLDRLIPRLEKARITVPVFRLLYALRTYGLNPAESDASPWSAYCPICDRSAAFGHERGKRHLTVGVGPRDGHALVKCHRHCDTHEIAQALGLDWGDLFNGPYEVAAWQGRRGPLPRKRMQVEVWLLLEMARGALSGELAQTFVMEELEAYGIDVTPQYARDVYRDLGGQSRRVVDRLRGACWVWKVLETGEPHKSATPAEGKQYLENVRERVGPDGPETRISPPPESQERVAVTQQWGVATRVTVATTMRTIRNARPARLSSARTRCSANGSRSSGLT